MANNFICLSLNTLLPRWSGGTQLPLRDVKYHKLLLRHCGVNTAQEAQNIFSKKIFYKNSQYASILKSFLLTYSKSIYIWVFFLLLMLWDLSRNCGKSTRWAKGHLRPASSRLCFSGCFSFYFCVMGTPDHPTVCCNAKLTIFKVTSVN